jgi:2-polyprenyl-3-methyl-5-hydroxy-6-metoxy-1,4-benzoquinol methylase
MNRRNDTNIERSTCPLCKGEGKLMLNLSKLYFGQKFSIHICDVCEMCYTFPFPSDDLLENIYSGDYWLRKKNDGKGGVISNLVDKFNQLRLAMTIRPLLKRLPPGASILEVGCGNGQLAWYLKRRGFKIQVTDVSRDILDEVWKLYGINGYCGNLDHVDSSRSYDAIIFNNVLEHLRSPLQTLKVTRKLMNPGGIIYIEVPNIKSLQFGLFHEYWYGLAIPEHLLHFSSQSLRIIALEEHLQMVWSSTFSPRFSAAGYVVSLFPSLRPDNMRKPSTRWKLFPYLCLQMLFLPLAYIESLAGLGASIRVLYRRQV